MAGIKFSALHAVASALLPDLMPVVQAGITSKETLSQIATLFNANLTFLPLAGGTMSGAINMGSHQINFLTDPTSAQDAATKAYVDATAQGLTIQGACRVATTGALTVTYNNVSVSPSGVSATLTNAGAQAAIVIDGVTLSVNDRVLVKNQASALQNGIYTVTNVGSGATNWVMTRATDYDQPAEIQPGDLVVITAGTANANSSWLQTATVTSVGVDSITFSQFSASLPITVPNGGTGLTTTTAYGVITGGTTATGAFQNAGTGAAGAIFQGNGSAALPTWSTTTYPSTNAINTLLYASSANVMSALATVNSAFLKTRSGGVPTWNSTLPINKVTTQLITTTGAYTYTPTAGTLFAIFELQAGGGGSGGTTGAGASSACGGAGAAGVYMRVLVSGATNLAAVSGSVGVGGAAGTSGNNAGGNGGNTTLIVNSGSTWTAGGGAGGGGTTAGGTAQAAGANAQGGANTTGTNGTLMANIPGQSSSTGYSNGAVTATGVLPTQGGSSQLGRGGHISNASATGTSGFGYGGGAGGGLNGSGSNQTGTIGQAGGVLITEFGSA